MRRKPQPVQAWSTSDGETFLKREEAESHQVEVDVGEVLERYCDVHFSAGDGSTHSRDRTLYFEAVVNFICSQREALVEVLAEEESFAARPRSSDDPADDEEERRRKAWSIIDAGLREQIIDTSWVSTTIERSPSSWLKASVELIEQAAKGVEALKVKT